MKKDIIFVTAQFFLFALYFVDWQFIKFELGDWWHYCSLVFVVLGLLMVLLGILSLNANFSPFPTPKSNSSLISHGVYAYVRHPVYAGILLSLFAYALFSGSVFRLLVTLALLGILYLKSNLEEQLLQTRFPEYAGYKLRTGRFFPKKKAS